MIKRPDPTEIRPEARLLDRVRREGPVLSLPGGVVGVFSPALATKVDKANTEELKMAESLVDYFKLRKNSNPVAWREIRALLTEQSGKLATPEHMKALYGRMRDFLHAQAGQEQDLTKLVWRAVSRALIPLVLDDLDGDGVRKVVGEQEMRFRIQQEQKLSFRQRVSDFLLMRAATRAVTRCLQHRIRGKDPHDDFAQALLTLVERIGVDRVTYLVTVQFIAISGVPGTMAACLLYGMARYPEWRERIRSEMAELDEDELYSLPVRKLPCTLRFIKEAMRLWTTPFVTRRVAALDIELDEVAVKKGETYELSSYIQHHSEQYWDNPEVFDPDRWLASRKPEAKGAYVPFGFAPRSCVGASVGHAQLILFCALATRDFNFEVSTGHEPWMRMDGFAVPNDLLGTVSVREPASRAAEARSA